MDGARISATGKTEERSTSPTGSDGLVDHLFRVEAGKMVAALARMFGLHNLQLAEDVVQETMLKALLDWRFKQAPPAPRLWLYKVARNKAIDIIRSESRRRRFEFESEECDHHTSLIDTIDELFLEPAIRDSQLRMMFACCHPSLPRETQIALVLKILCGFGVHEIARAFLSSEETIAKRIYRARKKLRSEHISLELPTGRELIQRVDSVRSAIYLLFNEGYCSITSDAPIRRDLCSEALRLALLLDEFPHGPHGPTRALIALMLFQSARFDARLDNDGEIILLRDQQRELWDWDLITQGFRYLCGSTEGDELSDYHLEAGIAACHCAAPSARETDWNSMVGLYDLLLQRKRSPVIELNRAIVIAELEGPQRAIEEVEKIEGIATLASYYHLQTTLGELYLQLGRHAAAAQALSTALELTTSPAEQRLLRDKLDIIQRLRNRRPQTSMG